MMSLTEQINADLKAAMKSGDSVKLNTIRSIRAQIIEFSKNGSGEALVNQLESVLKDGKAKYATLIEI
jgi:uncharacterized protein YqeY